MILNLKKTALLSWKWL